MRDNQTKCINQSAYHSLQKTSVTENQREATPVSEGNGSLAWGERGKSWPAHL